MKTLVDTSKLSRTEWEEARSSLRGLGGSDIASALGLSPFRSRVELWAEKTGRLEKQPQNAAMRRGVMLESVCRNYYREETGRDVIELHEIIGHDDHAWLFYNADGKVVNGTDGLFEAKTARSRSMAQYFDHGEFSFPIYYAVQIQYGLFVTGWEWASGALLIDGEEFHWRDFPGDEQMQEWIFDGVREFWNYVEKDISPPEESAKTDYRKIFPEARLKAIDVDIRELCKAYETARIEASRFEEDKTRFGNQIKQILGEHDAATFQGKVLATWTNNKEHTKFNEDAFKKEQPVLYEHYLHKSPGARVLRIK